MTSRTRNADWLGKIVDPRARCGRPTALSARHADIAAAL